METYWQPYMNSASSSCLVYWKGKFSKLCNSAQLRFVTWHGKPVVILASQNLHSSRPLSLSHRYQSRWFLLLFILPSSDVFSNRHEVAQLSKPWLDPDGKLSILLVYFDGVLRLYGCGVYEFASIQLPEFNAPLEHKVGAHLSALIRSFIKCYWHTTYLPSTTLLSPKTNKRWA